MMLGGRGAGKTISGAQWSIERGRREGRIRFGLIAPTFTDVRDTMIEGESGLLSVLDPSELLGGSIEVAYNKTRGELTLANGAYYKAFSSERPDRLRGPQFHYAWADEASSFRDANLGDALNTTWANLKLAVRLGEHPQTVITTTPKPNKLTLELVKIGAPRMRLVRATSYENRDNLADAWWEEVVAPYEGTRLGRQEIHAEILEDVEGALWSYAELEALRVAGAPELTRIVVGVDPNAESTEAANSAGVVVVGRDNATPFPSAWVLGDLTTTRGGPRAWAQAAVDAYYDFQADRIVAEKNQGGEMVRVMLETVDPNVPIKLVSAAVGKRTRAEPVASIYEQGRAHHVGIFADLEAEMATWTPGARSPDRMDALVWAMTELLLQKQGGPAKVYRPRGQIPTSRR